MKATVGVDGPAVSADDWAEVYQAVASDLVRFATLLVGAGAADDVVSEATIRILRTVVGRPVDRPAAYLYRAVANTASNHHRAAGRRNDREGRHPAPGTTAEAAEPRPEVARAVASLSPQQRAVVYLTYWSDLTPRQVAEHLELSEGSVRRQLARARRKLRGLLDG